MARYEFPQDLVSSNRPFVLFANVSSGDAIFLYMPAGFTLNDGAAYGDLDVGLVGKVMSNAFNTARNAAEGDTDALNKAGAQIAGGNVNKSGAIAAIMASMGNTAGVSAMSAEAVNQGVAVNPNTVLQFSNNEIRNHSFEFQLVPETQGEANTIKNIIKAFRVSMYAEKQGDYLLSYPDKWRCIFNAGGYMPYHTSEMFLTGCTANYNPTGNMAHEGNAPNETTLQLQFRETKALHRDEIKKLEG